MSVTLYENLVLREGTGRNLRILWLPNGGEDVTLIDTAPGGGLPFHMPRVDLNEQLDVGTAVALAEDPAAADIRTDSSLSSAEITIRDRRYDYILPLVEDPERSVLDEGQRASAISAHIGLRGGSKKTVYAWLGLWWRGGQLPNALVPAYSASAKTRKVSPSIGKKRGRPRYVEGRDLIGTNVTPEMIVLMQAGRPFLDRGMSVRQAYNEMLLLNFSTQVIVDGQRRNRVKPDHEVPSEDQFIYHVVRKIGRGDVLKSVKGDTRFERRNRPRTGTAKNFADGPGSIYQIDATICDIYLRSKKYPDRLIGRPVLYIVIDVYTRMIVGYHVALSGPSWETAKLALMNAMSDKVGYCASLGRVIADAQWPSRHVCRKLVIDRGTDVAGSNGAAAAKGLGYKRARLPPYRPDWKGLVESRFDLIQEGEIKWAPGASHGRERGQPKKQLDALYTLSTFNELILNYILNYNRSFLIANPPSSFVSVDGRPPTPLDLWEFGCKALSAPQIAERRRVQANLMHTAPARETDKGLLFNGLHYQSADPEKMRMFRRVPGRRWATHEIRFDPRDMATVLLPVDRGAKFETFYLTPADKDFAGWTQDEVRDFRAAAREGRRLAADDMHVAMSDHQANQADLTRRVMAEAAGVRLTPASAVGIGAARAEEVRDIRRDGAWTTASPPETRPLLPPPSPAPSAPPTAAGEHAPPPEKAASVQAEGAGPPSRMDRLMARRAEALRKIEEAQ